MRKISALNKYHKMVKHLAEKIHSNNLCTEKTCVELRQTLNALSKVNLVAMHCYYIYFEYKNWATEWNTDSLVYWKLRVYIEYSLTQVEQIGNMYLTVDWREQVRILVRAVTESKVIITRLQDTNSMRGCLQDQQTLNWEFLGQYEAISSDFSAEAKQGLDQSNIVLS